MTAPTPSSPAFVPFALADADLSYAPGWGERIRSLALHAGCWLVLLLTVWPLLPQALQSHAGRGLDHALAHAQAWTHRAWDLLPLDAVQATGALPPPERTCAPVCVH